MLRRCLKLASVWLRAFFSLSHRASVKPLPAYHSAQSSSSSAHFLNTGIQYISGIRCLLFIPCPMTDSFCTSLLHTSVCEWFPYLPFFSLMSRLIKPTIVQLFSECWTSKLNLHIHVCKHAQAPACLPWGMMPYLLKARRALPSTCPSLVNIQPSTIPSSWRALESLLKPAMTKHHPPLRTSLLPSPLISTLNTPPPLFYYVVERWHVWQCKSVSSCLNSSGGFSVFWMRSPWQLSMAPCLAGQRQPLTSLPSRVHLARACAGSCLWPEPCSPHLLPYPFTRWTPVILHSQPKCYSLRIPSPLPPGHRKSWLQCPAIPTSSLYNTCHSSYCLWHVWYLEGGDCPIHIRCQPLELAPCQSHGFSNPFPLLLSGALPLGQALLDFASGW